MPKKEMFSHINGKLLVDKNIVLFVFVISLRISVSSKFPGNRNIRIILELVRNAEYWAPRHTESEDEFFTIFSDVVYTYESLEPLIYRPLDERKSTTNSC